MSAATFHDPAVILETIGKQSKARCAARGVLTVLASFARYSGPDAGTCYPSMKRIAELAGVTIRTVRRAIARLVQLGEIEVIERGTGRRNTLYRLTILLRAKMTRQGGQKRTPNSSESTYTPKSPKTRRRSRSHRDSWRSRGHDGGKANASGPSPCPSLATPAPVSRVRSAEKGLAPVLSDPERPPAKWRALTAEQVQEAQTACDPVQWNRYRLSAGLDGVSADDLDAAAAHRWRSDAILRGVSVA